VRGAPYALAGMDRSLVLGRLPGVRGHLSSLDCSLGTATPVVVPTTVPDIGLVCIL